jgi:hypothetical protein
VKYVRGCNVWWARMRYMSFQHSKCEGVQWGSTPHRHVSHTPVLHALCLHLILTL